MKFFKKWSLVLGSLSAFPVIIHAGWASDIFGIGQAGEAAAEATVWVMLIKAVQGSLPVLMFLLLAVLAMVQLVAASRVNNDFSLVFKTAMQDDKITGKELVFLGWQGLVTFLLVAALVLSALFELYVMWSGLTDLMSFQAAP